MSSDARWPHLADAADIMDWPRRVTSRYEFPGLIRRLIRRDNDQVVRAEMRDAEGVGVEGYDGMVDALRATPFVPQGRSLWELGVGNDFRRKANDDFRKRTNNPLGENPAESTFVFVTPHRWDDKDEWALGKKQASDWLDVRVYDVDNIMQVLEQAPAVHTWLSEVLGKPATAAQSLDRWWSSFSRRSAPALSTGIVLAGRADAAQQLLGLLEEDLALSTISANSVDDCFAFVASTVLSTPEELRDDLLARTLIVLDPTAIRRLDNSSNLILLLPYSDELRRDAEQAAANHILLLCDNDVPVDLAIPPVDIDEVDAALLQDGVEANFARRLARAAGNSVRSFQRVATQRPPVGSEWRGVFISPRLRRAWLLGSWTTSRTGDLDVFQLVVGESFEATESEFRLAARGADPIFSNVGSIWAVVDPEEQIEFSGLQLSRSDFIGFERAVQNVLGAIDPALDLPPEQRWQAAILGKSRLHSRELRKGIAITLALLGARGSGIDLGDGLSGADWATGLVRSLLKRANDDQTIQLWASLSDVLPFIAEAAPDQFFGSLASAVKIQDFGPNIFLDDQGSGMTISSPHSGLLWALEATAWDRQTFSRAVDLLAQLDKLDTGGRLQNRPFNSLKSIFNLQKPQTLASPQERFQVLDALVRRHPGVGKRLLIALLPGSHELIFSSARPRFRLEIEEEDVDLQKYTSYLSDVVDRVLTAAQKDFSLWPSIIAQIGSLPPDGRAKILDSVSKLDSLTESDRVAIWKTGDELVRHHREYNDASWALPSDELDELERVISQVAPQDPRTAHGWLFEEMYPGIRVADIGEAEGALREKRKIALELIHEKGGFDSLLDFAKQVKLPAIVGYSLPDANLVTDLDMAGLFDDLSEDAVSFAGGYFRRRSELDPAVLYALCNEFDGRPTVQARLLSHLPDLESAWSKVAESHTDVQAVYWREFRIVGRGPEFDLLNQAARRLLDNGWPSKALDLLNIYSHGGQSKPNPEYVAEALESLLSRGDEIRRVPPYHIQTGVEYVRAADFDDDRVANLEWKFLPILTNKGDELVLERKLALEPDSFVQIISYAYKRASNEEADSDDQSLQLARNAHELLHAWRTIPGSAGRGKPVDAEALNRWFAQTGELLSQVDRYDVGMQTAGGVLAFAQEDEDGSWPCAPVRDLIEDVGDDQLDQGFRIGCFNKRGPVWRSLREGGKKEYELAVKYRGWAERITNTHPRVAAILRSLAETYEVDGRREDEEAQRHRQGIQ